MSLSKPTYLIDSLGKETDFELLFTKCVLFCFLQIPRIFFFFSQSQDSL